MVETSTPEAHKTNTATTWAQTIPRSVESFHTVGPVTTNSEGPATFIKC